MYECMVCAEQFEFESELEEHTNDSSSHMSRITDRLFVGACWNASNTEELKRANIGLIISMAEEFPRLASLDESVRFVHYDLCDSMYEFILPKIIRAANDIFWSPTPVLVHCALGKSRSVSAALVYLMLVKRQSFEDAYEMIKSKRQVMRPNKNYVQQLQALDRTPLFLKQWTIIAHYLHC